MTRTTYLTHQAKKMSTIRITPGQNPSNLAGAQAFLVGFAAKWMMWACRLLKTTGQNSVNLLSYANLISKMQQFSRPLTALVRVGKASSAANINYSNSRIRRFRSANTPTRTKRLQTKSHSTLYSIVGSKTTRKVSLFTLVHHEGYTSREKHWSGFAISK